MNSKINTNRKRDTTHRNIISLTSPPTNRKQSRNKGMKKSSSSNNDDDDDDDENDRVNTNQISSPSTVIATPSMYKSKSRLAVPTNYGATKATAMKNTRTTESNKKKNGRADNDSSYLVSASSSSSSSNGNDKMTNESSNQGKMKSKNNKNDRVEKIQSQNPPTSSPVMILSSSSFRHTNKPSSVLVVSTDSVVSPGKRKKPTKRSKEKNGMKQTNNRNKGKSGIDDNNKSQVNNAFTSGNKSSKGNMKSSTVAPSTFIKKTGQQKDGKKNKNSKSKGKKNKSNINFMDTLFTSKNGKAKNKDNDNYNRQRPTKKELYVSTTTTLARTDRETISTTTMPSISPTYNELNYDDIIIGNKTKVDKNNEGHVPTTPPTIYTNAVESTSPSVYSIKDNKGSIRPTIHPTNIVGSPSNLYIPTPSMIVSKLPNTNNQMMVPNNNDITKTKNPSSVPTLFLTTPLATLPISIPSIAVEDNQSSDSPSPSISSSFMKLSRFLIGPTSFPSSSKDEIDITPPAAITTRNVTTYRPSSISPLLSSTMEGHNKSSNSPSPSLSISTTTSSILPTDVSKFSSTKGMWNDSSDDSSRVVTPDTQPSSILPIETQFVVVADPTSSPSPSVTTISSSLSPSPSFETMWSMMGLIVTNSPTIISSDIATIDVVSTDSPTSQLFAMDETATPSPSPTSTSVMDSTKIRDKSSSVTYYYSDAPSNIVSTDSPTESLTISQVDFSEESQESTILETFVITYHNNASIDTYVDIDNVTAITIKYMNSYARDYSNYSSSCTISLVDRMQLSESPTSIAYTIKTNCSTNNSRGANSTYDESMMKAAFQLPQVQELLIQLQALSQDNPFSQVFYEIYQHEADYYASKLYSLSPTQEKITASFISSVDDDGKLSLMKMATIIASTFVLTFFLVGWIGFKIHTTQRTKRNWSSFRTSPNRASKIAYRRLETNDTIKILEEDDDDDTPLHTNRTSPVDTLSVTSSSVESPSIFQTSFDESYFLHDYNIHDTTTTSTNSYDEEIEVVFHNDDDIDGESNRTSPEVDPLMNPYDSNRLFPPSTALPSKLDEDKNMMNDPLFIPS
jgi:hypothetical protein